MARTFVEGFGRLLNETKDMEVVRLVAIVLRRTRNGRVWTLCILEPEKNMEFDS